MGGLTSEPHRKQLPDRYAELAERVLRRSWWHAPEAGRPHFNLPETLEFERRRPLHPHVSARPLHGRTWADAHPVGRNACDASPTFSTLDEGEVAHTGTSSAALSMIEFPKARHLFNGPGATRRTNWHTAAETVAESHTRLAGAASGNANLSHRGGVPEGQPHRLVTAARDTTPVTRLGVGSEDEESPQFLTRSQRMFPCLVSAYAPDPHTRDPEELATGEPWCWLPWGWADQPRG